MSLGGNNSFFQNDVTEFVNYLKRKSDIRYALRSHNASPCNFAPLRNNASSKPTVAYLARNLYCRQRYSEAASVIQRASAEDNYCQYILLKCKYNLKKYEDVLNYSEDEASDQSDPFLRSTGDNYNPGIPSIFQSMISPDKVRSEILVLRGNAMQCLEKEVDVPKCYTDALGCVVTNHQALVQLMDNRLLTSVEYKKLFQSLPKGKHNLMQFVTRKLYHIELSSFIENESSDLSIISLIPQLKFSVDVNIAAAVKLFLKYDYKKCYHITERMIRRIGMANEKLVTLHACTLMELKRSVELYSMACYMIEHNRDCFLTWFVRACHYYSVKEYHIALLCMKKALALNPTSGPAWLLLGHMHAAKNERDEAVKAYIKAKNILAGVHIPSMYIGIECGLKKNFEIAEKFLRSSAVLGASDPHLFHELAVVMHNLKRYNEAELCCLQSVNLIRNEGRAVLTNRWEPLFTNAGHISHQLKKYTQSLEHYKESLTLFPLKSTALNNTALGHLMLNNLPEADDILCKMVITRPTDKVAVCLLTYIVEKLAEEGPSDDLSPFMESSNKAKSTDPEDVRNWFVHKELLYNPSADFGDEPPPLPVLSTSCKNSCFELPDDTDDNNSDSSSE